ncbi:MAG: hypothetical protein UY97_C0001G0001, partial [Parcubacteria group bacterium GW2011_GWB1_57_6]
MSFCAEYQKLRRFFNARIDSPASIEEIRPSHPAGFVREMKKRRITIVESYLIIICYLESEHHKEHRRRRRPGGHLRDERSGKFILNFVREYRDLEFVNGLPDLD